MRHGHGSIPDHLKSTCRMVQNAYPEGVPKTDYHGLIIALYSGMSDRNLAELISHLGLSEETKAQSDVSGILEYTKEEDKLSATRVVRALAGQGYAYWLSSEILPTFENQVGKGSG